MLLYETRSPARGEKCDFLRKVNGTSLVINPRLMQGPTARPEAALSLIRLGAIPPALDAGYLPGREVLAGAAGHYSQAAGHFLLKKL